MKISELKITVVDNPHAHLVTRGIKGGTAAHQIVFLRLMTDEGFEGNAFAWGGRSGLATAHLTASIIRPLLIGEDPLNRGVAGLMKTAALCEAFGLNCEVHTTTNALLDAANLHVCCAIRNCEYFEILIPREPFCFGVRNPIRIDGDGLVHVSDAPGLGVDLDWQALERYQVAEI